MATELDSSLDASRAALADLFATTSFAGAGEMFGTFEEPVALDGILHDARFFKGLTGHQLPGKTSTVAYSFFVATPRDGARERFIADAEKKRAVRASEER